MNPLAGEEHVVAQQQSGILRIGLRHAQAGELLMQPLQLIAVRGGQLIRVLAGHGPVLDVLRDGIRDAVQGFQLLVQLAQPAGELLLGQGHLLLFQQRQRVVIEGNHQHDHPEEQHQIPAQEMENGAPVHKDSSLSQNGHLYVL